MSDPSTSTPKRKTLKGIRERYPGSFSIVIELGYETDATGKKTRKQQWVNFKATPGLSLAAQRKEAEAKRIELLSAQRTGTFVAPSKITLIAWLRDWLVTSVKPPLRRPATYALFKSITEHHLAKSRIALMPLQRLRASDLEAYLGSLTCAPASRRVHRAVLTRALGRTVRDGLLMVNPATKLEARTGDGPPSHAARVHCWSALEVARFLAVATTASPQVAAFMYLALDSGARKSELAGLLWTDLDLDAGTLRIERQLDRAEGEAPVFGPTKTKKVRTLSLGPETIAQLRLHRQAQLEHKMKNRMTYVDYGLIFAKEDGDLQTPHATLGQAIGEVLSGRVFQKLIVQAGVKRIKFHGCRHTAATLMLQAGVAPHVAAARLGHRTEMLLNVYAHALPDQGQKAAAALADLVHGVAHK